MTALQLLPAALSLLVLAAHFLRSGDALLVAIAVGATALLLVRRPWSAVVLQGLLVVGAVEWLRTLMLLVTMRQQIGLPYGRLSVILVAVIVFTLVSAGLIQTRRSEAYFSRAS